MPSPQRYRTFVISENMALRSGTRSPLAHESEDPFYAPTNLATRLRANPQPQRPQHPPAGPSYPNDGSSALFGELMQMTPSSHKFEGSTPRPPPPPPLPPANRGGGGPVARGSPDSLGRTLFALVLVLFLLWRGAASSLAELTAQNARLMEERGQFVMSLMDWNQRLLDTDPAWLPSANDTLVWTYGYTSPDPLPRPPLAPLAVRIHEAAFSTAAPLSFPPPALARLSPRIVGLEVSLSVEAKVADVPRYGWWRATELLAMGGERVVLQAVPPPVAEVEYFARVFYFVPL